MVGIEGKFIGEIDPTVKLCVGNGVCSGAYLAHTPLASPMLCSTTHRSWVKLLEMEDVDDLCLDFTITKETFGQTVVVELKDDGEDIEVDDDNKHEYIALLVGPSVLARVFRLLLLFLTACLWMELCEVT